MIEPVRRRGLELPAPVRAMLLDEAARHAPAECCGVLLGAAGAPLRIVDAIAVPNRSPAEDDYLIDHTAVRRLELSARAAGRFVTGFYHSHPRGPAQPSGRDLEAAWPGYIYLVIGGAIGGAPGELRAWRLLEDRQHFEEIPVMTAAS